MKEFMVWNSSLTVYVDKIDDQHKELFRKMNEFMNAVVAGKGKQELRDFAGFAVDYTDFHFRDEEALMLKHNYPGYDAQKKAHDYFRNEITQMKGRVDIGEVTSEMVISVVQKMGDWLLEHIRRMDTEMGKYVKNRL